MSPEAVTLKSIPAATIENLDRAFGFAFLMGLQIPVLQITNRACLASNLHYPDLVAVQLSFDDLRIICYQSLCLVVLGDFKSWICLSVQVGRQCRLRVG